MFKNFSFITVLILIGLLFTSNGVHAQETLPICPHPAVEKLRQEILAANDTPGKDTIILRPCVYLFSEPYTTSDGLSTANALPIIRDELVIRGNKAILRRNNLHGIPDFRLLETTATLSMNNLGIENGRFEDAGGGMLVRHATIYLANIRWQDNTVTNYFGGGLSILHGEANITNSQFIGNYAEHGGGGLDASHSKIDIENTLFINNEAGFSGGGLEVSHSELHLSNSFIGNNLAAEYGGGVDASHSTVEIVTTAVMENESGHNSGGLDLSHSEITIVKSEISNNIAAWRGGGLTITHSGFQVNDSTIANNLSERRGGGTVVQHSKGELNHTNITANLTTNDGGGLFAQHSTVAMDNSQFHGNLAAKGGGAYLQFVSGRMFNGLWLNNSASEAGSALYVKNSSTENEAIDLRHLTLIGNNEATELIYTDHANFQLVNSIMMESGIGIEGDGNGQTAVSHTLFYAVPTETVGPVNPINNLTTSTNPLDATYHPTPWSPAIDYGLDVQVIEDIVGNPRPQGSGFDLGAYEQFVVISLP
ncbi:MAG: choice-of-anchor Q domain-containing protein [Chloroflexota bacterium]